jgi:predicted metal-dependent HD superfamily phosphohydrolase
MRSPLPYREEGAAPGGSGVVGCAQDDAQRFAALWDRCVPSPPARDGTDVYAELETRYAAPYRHFHNLAHIRECVRRVDEVAPLLVDPDAVELALWFHDVVYDVGTCTNERRSAEMFLTLSSGARFRFRYRVCGLIMATRHARSVDGNDRRFIVDIDLAGFGAPWDEFMRNGACLRAESAALSDEQYHAGQLAFLQRLQRRDRLFATDYFRDRYEAVARENLRRVLEQLAQQGYACAPR